MLNKNLRKTNNHPLEVLGHQILVRLIQQTTIIYSRVYHHPKGSAPPFWGQMMANATTSREQHPPFQKGPVTFVFPLVRVPNLERCFVATRCAPWVVDLEEWIFSQMWDLERFWRLTEAQFWDHEIRRLNIPTAPTIVLHGVMGILEMAENFHEVSLGLF